MNLNRKEERMKGKQNIIVFAILGSVAVLIILLYFSTLLWMNERADKSCKEMGHYKPVPERCVG
jgi:hypothetical protein